MQPAIGEALDSRELPGAPMADVGWPLRHDDRLTQDEMRCSDGHGFSLRSAKSARAFMVD